MVGESDKKFVVDVQSLPEGFPTHRHTSEFWEALGRVVATFGFLEETLGKAIFAFTATRPYPPEEIDAAYKQWLPSLDRALSDPLGGLIESFRTAVRSHPDTAIDNLDDLINDIRSASKLRNVVCHGSWRGPDDGGRSIPFYVNRQNEIFESQVDVKYLSQLQRHAAELACVVISKVTQMGWQFPGSAGPGTPIWNSAYTSGGKAACDD